VARSGEAFAVVKLNLFSPLPPLRSDIARVTTNLLPLLGKRAEIVVWSSDPKWDPVVDSLATIRPYDVAHPPWRDISEADVTFYQMGNDPRYHHAIWRMSQQHPGIVILHDVMMQHFFSGLVFHELGLTRRDYLDLVERNDGPNGRALAETHLHGFLSTEELGQQSPLTGAATENALAVIVHSRAAFPLVPEETPVAYLPLCVGAPAPGEVAFANKEAGVYRISLFGFLGPNRRLPVLLRALADFPERTRFRLDVYGTIDGAEKIQQLIGRLGLGDLVAMHGFVDHAELEQALRRTDLVVNLRNPSMGEASGSQLHLWQYGLPALVTRGAWYETLPENTVAFVRPDHETEDIQTHLGAFLADPEKYRELGRNGRRYVAENHSMESYVDGLLEIAARAPEFQSAWLARDLARRAASSMNGWCDRTTIQDFIPNVAAQIEKLVAGKPKYASGSTSAPSTVSAESI
jgi:glycosyltransferase involved in cell wall biosynthesis